MITNRNFYRRYKNFSGSLIDWFNTCVDENDIFRVWYKGDDEDLEADYVQIVNVIDIKNDYLLGLQTVEWKGEEPGKESVCYRRLSDISEFSIIANEEDYE